MSLCIHLTDSEKREHAAPSENCTEETKTTPKHCHSSLFVFSRFVFRFYFHGGCSESGNHNLMKYLKSFTGSYELHHFRLSVSYKFPWNHEKQSIVRVYVLVRTSAHSPTTACIGSTDSMHKGQRLERPNNTNVLLYVNAVGKTWMHAPLIVHQQQSSY